MRSNILNVLAKDTSHTSSRDYKYTPQFCTRDLVVKYAYKEISTDTDLNWQDSGAETIEEYSRWSHSACGMACLQMVLHKELCITENFVVLCKAAQGFDVYIFNQDGEPGGLIYVTFPMYLKQTYGLKSHSEPKLSLQRIIQEFDKGNHLILSVSPHIRDIDKNYNGKKGGHLVLLTGIDTNNQTLTIHNPSGHYQKSQENHEINFNDFLNYYSGRGLVIKKNQA